MASTLDPEGFISHVTDPGNPIHLPAICFADLRLGELARDPDTGSIHDLPYYAIEHVRDCLRELKQKPEKRMKTVDRIQPQVFSYRTIATGIYIGNAQRRLCYPFPTEQELQTTHFEWWRSASIMGDRPGLG